MNRINPKKLLHSKWTAAMPTYKEKHFIVSEVEYDDENNVASCVIEAVLSNRIQSIDWETLKDDTVWKQGWK